jgi:hypothetical protein
VPDPILIILFIVFFVLPLLEKAMKKRQPPPPPPPDARRERPAQLEHGPPRDDAALPSARPHGSAPVGVEDEAAADMIPDDLWEVLTGERRSRPQRPGRVEPAPAPEHSAEPAEPAEHAHWRDDDWRQDRGWGGGFEREDASPVEQESVYETDIAGEEIDDEISATERHERGRRRYVDSDERALQRGRDLDIPEPVLVPAPAPGRRGSIVADAPLVPARGGRVGVRDAFERHAQPALIAPAARPRFGALGSATQSDLRRAFVLKEILDRPKGLD